MLLLLVAVSAFAGAMDIYVDCEAENKLDIVFVIDTSGSMGWVFEDILYTTDILDTALADLDVRWGIITFADSVEGEHDWDPFNPGIDLTDDYSLFRADIDSMGAMGGGDTPEEALDALWVTAHCINWRPTALHVVFLFTDAVFCESTDSIYCTNCFSNLTKEECLDTLMNHDVMLFPIVRDPLYYSSCVPSPPYHNDYWRLAADTTGGAFWMLNGSWQDSLLNWASYSARFLPTGYIAVRNNLASSVEIALYTETIGDIWVDSTEYLPRTLGPGEIDTFGLRVDVGDTATKPAFHVIGDFDGGAHVETLLVTLDSCGCHEAVVEIKRGWNAVSLPSDYTTVPLSRFETAIGDAFLYDAAVGDYEATDILAPGMGYWVLSDDSARIMFAGEPIDGIWMPTFRGWNLLGGGSLPFYATEGESLGAPIWPMFEFLDGEYEPADIIEIGKGYWLLEDASGRWEAP